MSFALLNAPFYEGVATGPSSLVPEPYDVAIGGHPYMIDWQAANEGAYSHESIPYLKAGAQVQGEIDERSLNPEALWRRSQTSWDHGAGQRHLDRRDSDPARFWKSKGVDPWERWELSLLPSADVTFSLGANPHLAVAGDWLFYASEAGVGKTFDGTAQIPVTGGPTLVPSITSDGATVYLAGGTQGIFTVGKDSETAALWQFAAPGDPYDLVAYVKSRVMAAGGPDLYNVILPSTTAVDAGTKIFTHRIPTWQWVGFAEGESNIYAAGFAGDKSVIYRIGIEETSDLAAPIVAGSLPDGEIVHAISGYLDFILIGTSLGVRLAIQGENGDLSIGAVIETSGPVRCFEGQGRFVWFGWERYDSDSTGLGRLDLTTFNGVAPAYASDLMVDFAQENVTAVVTFAGRRMFALENNGLAVESLADRVTSGWIEPGVISYDLPDDKIAYFMQVTREAPYTGMLTVELSVNGGGWVDLGSLTEGQADQPFDARQLRGETIESRLTLTGPGPAETAFSIDSILVNNVDDPIQDVSWTPSVAVQDDPGTTLVVSGDGLADVTTVAIGGEGVFGDDWSYDEGTDTLTVTLNGGGYPSGFFTISDGVRTAAMGPMTMLTPGEWVQPDVQWSEWQAGDLDLVSDPSVSRPRPRRQVWEAGVDPLPAYSDLLAGVQPTLDAANYPACVNTTNAAKGQAGYSRWWLKAQTTDYPESVEWSVVQQPFYFDMDADIADLDPDEKAQVYPTVIEAADPTAFYVRYDPANYDTGSYYGTPGDLYRLAVELSVALRDVYETSDPPVVLADLFSTELEIRRLRDFNHVPSGTVDNSPMLDEGNVSTIQDWQFPTDIDLLELAGSGEVVPSGATLTTVADSPTAGLTTKSYVWQWDSLTMEPTDASPVPLVRVPFDVTDLDSGDLALLVTPERYADGDLPLEIPSHWAAADTGEYREYDVWTSRIGLEAFYTPPRYRYWYETASVEQGTSPIPLTAGPTVLRVTLLAQPNPRSGRIITVPLLLAQQESVDGDHRDRDTVSEFTYLSGLRESKQVVLYQEGTETWPVVMDEYRLAPTGMTRPEQDNRWLNGTVICKLKSIEP